MPYSSFKYFIDLIDHQHDSLAILIDTLSEYLDSNNAVPIHIFSLIVLNTQAHFETEERLMNMIHYPDAPEHITEHDRLLEEIKLIDSNILAGEILLDKILLDFLKDWLQLHINKLDNKLIQFISK